jgi:DNA-binding MarR family transcriptional regulator
MDALVARVGSIRASKSAAGGSPSSAHSPKRMLFLDLVLSVFRLNGLLVAEGDAMTEDLGLTSARWKVIGVVALSTAGLTVPGIARVLGQSRQAVQRITDVMAQDGLITYQPNPKHKRSVLVLLTDEGKSAYHALREVQDPWAIRNTEDIPVEDLETALRLLALKRIAIHNSALNLKRLSHSTNCREREARHDHSFFRFFKPSRTGRRR